MKVLDDNKMLCLANGERIKSDTCFQGSAVLLSILMSCSLSYTASTRSTRRVQPAKKRHRRSLGSSSLLIPNRSRLCPMASEDISPYWKGALGVGPEGKPA